MIVYNSVLLFNNTCEVETHLLDFTHVALYLFL